MELSLPQKYFKSKINEAWENLLKILLIIRYISTRYTVESRYSVILAANSKLDYYFFDSKARFFQKMIICKVASNDFEKEILMKAKNICGKFALGLIDLAPFCLPRVGLLDLQAPGF